MFKQIATCRKSVMQNSIIFLDNENRSVLEKYLKDTHEIYHYHRNYDVKFSLNFIKLSENISSSNSFNSINEVVDVAKMRSIVTPRNIFHASPVNHRQTGTVNVLKRSIKEEHDEDIFSLRKQLLFKMDHTVEISEGERDGSVNRVYSRKNRRIIIKLLKIVNRHFAFLRSIFLCYRRRDWGSNMLLGILLALIIFDSVSE